MTPAPHIDDDPIGRRYGSRTVLAVLSRETSGRPRIVRVICDGGHVSEHRLVYLAYNPHAGTCRRCVQPAIIAATVDARRTAAAAKWRAMEGQRVGDRTVIAYEGLDDRHRHTLRMRCDCGAEVVTTADNAMRSSGCKACKSGRKSAAATVAIRAERASRYESLLAERARDCPEVWRIECADCGGSERCERCAVQVEAWADLAALIGGATLEEIGALMGLSRERVRQVEAVALRKLDTPTTRELAADRSDRDDDWATRYAEG